MTLPSASTTIAAIATPPGRGGVGVIRISGPQAGAIASQLTKQALPPARYAVLRRFYDADKQVIDEGLLLWFPAPHSFTGEDVVELQGHGAPVAQAALLQRLYQLGTIAAAAGEFSARAFANQRLDLVQAEAIADLIAADSQAAARSAVRALQGEFSEKINQLLEALITLRLHVEAAIDFPEEEIDFLSDGRIAAQLQAVRQQLQAVRQQARQGQLLRDGIQVVLAGRPNAGKSSLLNALAGTERAIVTDIAGTTRDLLQERIELDGLQLTITDTAGLRESNDQVEQIGIARAKQAFEQADLLLWLYDASTETNPEAALVHYFEPNDPRLVRIANKVDLKPVAAIAADAQPLSIKTGQGLTELIAHIRQRAGFAPAEDTIIARARHLGALARTDECLMQADLELMQGSGELMAEALRHAQQALGEITGQFSADDLLGRIFGSFCIGK